MTIPQTLALALQHHQSGRLAEAEAGYRQILAVEPGHVDALHLLGVIAHQVGRHDAAVELIGKAIALQPHYAEAHNNLGNASQAIGQLQRAIESYRQAIRLKPDYAEAYSNLGTACRDIGQLDEAIAACRQAIGLQPHYAEAHNNLGNALRDKGQLEEAIAAYRQAIALKPHYPEAHGNLGTAWRDLGHLDEAMAACRQALAFSPNDAEAHNTMGNCARDRGQLDEAVAAYRRAIALKPGFSEAHNNLGNALREQGQLDAAMAAYRQAILLKPDYAEAHGNLGTAWRDLGKLDEAMAACRQALALAPTSADAHNTLGNILKDQGQLDAAVAAYRQAIAFRPRFSEAYYNLGITLHDQGQPAEAIAAFHQAIAYHPHYAGAYFNLGNVLRDEQRMDEAVAAYRQGIALDPHFAEAHWHLGAALSRQGCVAESIAELRRAIELKPALCEAHSGVLSSLHYLPEVNAEALFQEHIRWDEIHARPLAERIPTHANGREPERRLRVGYVSPDFREHSVACFLESLLASHDAAQVEVFCYASVARPDGVTERLRRLAAHWRDIAGLPDVRAAELIGQDQIDILVDLAGHTAHHRLLLFARKPAPVQVTWLGYPDTTGLQAMDYRLTDALADPPQTTAHLHREQLIRLPHCAWCFHPSEQAPPVSTLPAMEVGHMTFGCFNNLSKITAPMLGVWADILRAVPDSRLLLKNLAFRDGSARSRLQTALAEAGITRYDLAGYQPDIAGHLASYSHVDIALDTFPYHGATTTCEALWMGVPVITQAGKTHESRVGVSLLTNAGLPELVARAPAEYVGIATELAHDLPRLSRLRTTLRSRMQASPLLDGPGFARNVEDAYRAIWRKWCVRP